MFNKCKNSKQQGDIGLGSCIAFFSSKCYVVSIPLTDSQDYDLVIEENGKLKKVQVKTTSFKINNKYYNFNLSVKGGNRTSKGSVKHFDNTKVDYIFVLCDNGIRYLIPSKEVSAKNCVTLYSPWDKYII